MVFCPRFTLFANLFIMQTLRLLPMVLVWLCIWPGQRGMTQPLPCDDFFYLFTADYPGTPSTLTRVRINPQSGRPEMTTVKADIGASLGAVGYNVADGYFYGLNPVTYELFRVDANGNSTNLGVPANIDKTLQYVGGTVSPLGRSLLVVGRSKDTNVDKKLVSINLMNNTSGFVSIVAGWNSQIESIAFDPEFGLLLGFDRATRRLVNISTGGFVTSNRYETNNNLVTIGSLFFNTNAELYGYGGTGTTETHFYKIDKINGRATNIGQGPVGRSTDGCACPYRIRFDKTVSPAEALPCAEVTYRYHITNTAGTAYTQVEIRDTFPEGFVITDISRPPEIGEVATGVGSNMLHINRMHLLLGDNEIEIKVRVGPRAGVYPTQGQVASFPLMIGPQVRSDDPSDDTQQSPTVLTILEGEEVLTDTLLYLCPDGTRRLRAQLAADSYQWNTGATGPTLDVTTPGVYSVIATTECGAFYDTVRVVPVAEPLSVDLGDDQTIEQGDPVRFIMRTNGAGNLQYLWQSEDDPTLTCDRCPLPAARPLTNATYTLLLTDNNGCSATDAFNVEVIPVRTIFAPTAFSPNGDGINDVFYLQGKTDARVLYLRIFDRWGNLVFQTENGYLNDPNTGWDGRTRGQTIEAGAYVFVAELEFADGIRRKTSGEITLLR